MSVTEKCPIFLDILVANVLQMRCELNKSHRFSAHLTTLQVLAKQGFECKRLVDNLAIDNPLMYAALALDCELQAWADAMDEDWSP